MASQPEQAKQQGPEDKKRLFTKRRLVKAGLAAGGAALLGGVFAAGRLTAPSGDVVNAGPSTPDTQPGSTPEPALPIVEAQTPNPVITQPPSPAPATAAVAPDATATTPARPTATKAPSIATATARPAPTNTETPRAVVKAPPTATAVRIESNPLKNLEDETHEIFKSPYQQYEMLLDNMNFSDMDLASNDPNRRVSINKVTGINENDKFSFRCACPGSFTDIFDGTRNQHSDQPSRLIIHRVIQEQKKQIPNGTLIVPYLNEIGREHAKKILDKTYHVMVYPDRSKLPAIGILPVKIGEKIPNNPTKTSNMVNIYTFTRLSTDYDKEFPRTRSYNVLNAAFANVNKTGGIELFELYLVAAPVNFNRNKADTEQTLVYFRITN